MRTIRQVLDLFAEEQRQLWALLLATAALAVVETVGVASILPFMTLITNPALIQQNEIVRGIFLMGGFESTNAFLVFVGVVVLAVITFNNAFSAFVTWATMRFIWAKQQRLSSRLLERYLSEPYAFYLNRNTSELSKNILTEVDSVINGVLVPGTRVIARALIALCILLLLFLVDPKLALIVAATLGGAYLLIYTAVRRQQATFGKQRVTANTARYRLANEALGGIKDVKVLGRESDFLERFQEPSRVYARTIASNATIAQIPRYALETVAFGGILLIILLLLHVRGDLNRVLPLLSLYAFAGYRLMPALQQIFTGLTQVRFHAPALEELHADMMRINESGPARVATTSGRPDCSCDPAGGIEVRGVTFSYPGADRPAVHDVTLRVRRNETLGLVGATGSGKTTLVDLVLGLHRPEQGFICIDGSPLDDDLLPSWRRRLGYVPQQIFLGDDTISRNIAFGIPEAEVDAAAVERAARTARLHDFILELAEGYQTLVGERGVRLSGGQRQRIGIARALYHNPDVLIMDEATSALDGITEDAVMQAIQDLSHSKTIILIAHRLSTVRDCDNIVLLDHGRVVAQGKFEELCAKSPLFRSMTQNDRAEPVRLVR